MTEKRKIEDDELVEIVGAGEFDAVGADCGCRPAPGSPGTMHLPEKDNDLGGDVEMEGI